MFVNSNEAKSLTFSSLCSRHRGPLQRGLTGYSPQQQTARVHISCYIHSGTETVNSTVLDREDVLLSSEIKTKGKYLH